MSETSDFGVCWVKWGKWPSGSVFLLCGQVVILNPLPCTFLQSLVSPCRWKRLVKSSWPWKCVWSPREQELGPCVAFNSLLCPANANLHQPRVLLLAGCEWMSEKLNMLSNVKLETLLCCYHCGNVRFAFDPDSERKGASLGLRSFIQGPFWQVGCNLLVSVIHNVYSCVKNKGLCSNCIRSDSVLHCKSPTLNTWPVWNKDRTCFIINQTSSKHF